MAALFQATFGTWRKHLLLEHLDDLAYFVYRGTTAAAVWLAVIIVVLDQAPLLVPDHLRSLICCPNRGLGAAIWSSSIEVTDRCLNCRLAVQKLCWFVTRGIRSDFLATLEIESLSGYGGSRRFSLHSELDHTLGDHIAILCFNRNFLCQRASLLLQINLLLNLHLPF